MIKQQKYKQKGFTLIEMVVVIAVMGILMGMAFQGFTTIQANARDTRRVADLRRMQTQLELYFARCGHYPTAGPCGTPGTGTGSRTRDQLITALEIVGIRRGEVPDDPMAAKDYFYNFGTNGLGYVIGATMERRGNNPEVTGDIFGLNCGTTAVPGTTFCLQS